MDLRAGTIPANTFDKAISGNPADARDRAQRERDEIEGRHGADAEVGPKVSENVAAHPQLAGNCIAKSYGTLS
jgi:hypothetical protein